jgi:hypothetical protein
MVPCTCALSQAATLIVLDIKGPQYNDEPYEALREYLHASM